MVFYNKAVRDKIPEIITKSGKTCNIKKLDNDEFLLKLEKKLFEEIQEYQQDCNIEELADVLEVIYRIAELKGISKEQFEQIRATKIQNHGMFTKNLFLIDTNDVD